MSSEVRRAGAAAFAFLALMTLAGCGSASPPSPPAGVDGLVVPTPSPEPDDFVEAVDNPWLPLVPGATWAYAGSEAQPEQARAVTVETGPVVLGVATTAVRTVGAGLDQTDIFAQDDEGNVWWFGREGEWRAGTDGAEAGIAMLATPRVGDGYRLALADGVVESRARVVALDEDRAVPLADYENLVTIETTSPLDGGLVQRAYYAPGVGLVLLESVAGGSGTELGLTAYDEPEDSA